MANKSTRLSKQEANFINALREAEVLPDEIMIEFLRGSPDLAAHPATLFFLREGKLNREDLKKLLANVV